VLLITDVKVQHIETVAVAVRKAVVTAVVFETDFALAQQEGFHTICRKIAKECSSRAVWSASRLLRLRGRSVDLAQRLPDDALPGSVVNSR
jgi:translation elongation factor EF-Ts